MIGTIHIDIEGGWGGSSRSLYELVKRLDRNRISPVVVHRQEGPVSQWYAAMDIPAYHVPEIGSYVPRREKAFKNFLASLPKLRSLGRAADRIVQIARQHRSQVIHLNYEGLFLLSSRLRARSPLPMIGHSRAHLPVNGWARWLAHKLSSNVEHMFFISPQEETRWRELIGIHDAPCEVLLNIAREPLPRQPFLSPPEVIYLGNLERSKGVERIIDVAAAVLEQGNPPFVFAIYGRARSNQAYLDELNGYCKARGVEHCVEFRGHTDTPEAVLARAFALLRLSEQNDPWGRDVIEASAAGVPILATGTYAGVVQDGINGFLYEAFDAKVVARRLVDLQRDSGAWQRLSAAGQALASDKFGGSAQAERFAGVVEALVRKTSILHRDLPIDYADFRRGSAET
jgi:glycosyltransferase involved in cell wall biosynthesis